jgi:hypothetical protein
MNLEANKSAVVAFYDLMFNQRQPVEAVRRYVGATELASACAARTTRSVAATDAGAKLLR